MAAKNSGSAASLADRQIVVERVFDAPPERVWKAWSQQKHVERWWGPRGFTNTFTKFDLKPGGEWVYTMHGPDGTDYPNHMVFQDVVPAERLTYLHNPNHKDAQFEVKVTFETVEGDKTKVISAMTFPTAEARQVVVERYGALQGAIEHHDRMGEYVMTIDSFEISRVFDAPPARIWKAWTDPEQLAKWWGPKGFTMLTRKLDLRPGGLFHYAMKGPEGHPMGGTMWGRFVYVEIIPEKKAIFINSFSDEKSGIARHPMAPTWPLEMFNIMTLDERDGKTVLTLRGAPIRATAEERETYRKGFERMRGGFGGTFDQLAAYLAGGDNEIVSSRVFDAPRELMWKAWSTPELFEKWWGPTGFTNKIHQFDFKPGGTWRIDMKAPDGSVFPNEAAFVDIVEPEKIVYDHLGPMHKFAVTTTFEDAGGKTNVAFRMRFTSKQETEAIRSFIEGANEQFLDRLAAVVANLKIGGK